MIDAILGTWSERLGHRVHRPESPDDVDYEFERLEWLEKEIEETARHGSPGKCRARMPACS